MAETKAIAPRVITRLRNDAELALAMLAGMQLEVFTQLEDGPASAEAIAESLQVRTDKLEPLLYALAAAELLELTEHGFGNSEEAAEYLIKGKPEYMGGVNGNLTFRWGVIGKTAETVKTGVPQARQNYSDDDPDALEKFLRGIQGEAANSGRELAKASDFSSARTVADIGGGSGGLAIALTESVPHLRATVVDLPNVIPIAEKIIAENGASDRVEACAADLLQAPLDGPYDVVVMRAFLQVFSREDAALATQNVAHAVAPGGSIHAIGRMIDNSRLSPISSVGFNLLTLNVFEAGGAYTEREYEDWLSAAEIPDLIVTPLSAGYTMISGTKSTTR